MNRQIRKNQKVLIGTGYYDPQGYYIPDQDPADYGRGLAILREQRKEMKKIQSGGLAAPSVIENLKKNIRRTTKRIREYDVGKVLKNVIFGVQDYTPISRKNLESDGDQKIIALRLGRYPIASQSQLETILKGQNIINNGIFDKTAWNTSGSKVLENAGYDKLFHLYSIATLANSQEMIIEKQTTVRIEPNTGANNKDTIAATRDPPHETVTVDLRGKSFTLAELMNKTQKKMGKSDFFGYNSFGSNCQFFMINMLASVKLLTPQLREFIDQDLDQLAEELPWWSKVVSNVGTELEARATSVQEGGGKLIRL